MASRHHQHMQLHIVLQNRFVCEIQKKIIPQKSLIVQYAVCICTYIILLVHSLVCAYEFIALNSSHAYRFCASFISTGGTLLATSLFQHDEHCGKNVLILFYLVLCCVIIVYKCNTYSIGTCYLSFWLLKSLKTSIDVLPFNN